MILGNTQRSTAVWARHSVLGWACQRRVFERLHSDPGVTRDTSSGTLLACKEIPGPEGQSCSLARKARAVILPWYCTKGECVGMPVPKPEVFVLPAKAAEAGWDLGMLLSKPSAPWLCGLLVDHTSFS